VQHKVLMLCAVLGCHLAYFCPLGFFDEILFGLFLITSTLDKSRRTLHFFLLMFLMTTYHHLFPQFVLNLPSTHFLIPFLMALGILILLRKGDAVCRMQLGRVKWDWAVMIIITGIISSAALLVWAVYSDNLGRGVNMVQALAPFPKWVVWCFVVPIFALVNAFSEEVVYRGVVQSTAQKVFPSVWMALLIQSSLFAGVHFVSGFPNGLLGYAMVFVYGLMLGFLKIRTGGMLAPFLAHVIADLTIGYFLYAKI